MTSNCTARPDRYDPATIRCAACGMAWDKDEAAPTCPREVALVPLKGQFVSGLPPIR